MPSITDCLRHNLEASIAAQREFLDDTARQEQFAAAVAHVVQRYRHGM